MSSLTTHCLCLAVSLAVLACVLFGLGTACLSLASEHGPCPHELVVTVISVAGGFLGLAVIFAAVFVRYRRGKVKSDRKSESAALTAKYNDVTSWEMTQPPSGAQRDAKEPSAVTYWIAQQVSSECSDVFVPDDGFEVVRRESAEEKEEADL